ncbi:MAG: DUF882 domain-containing protein [Myxococcales bacterium]|nr:DUF882 domain-containing protein [Myxococcales bacterium]
MGKFGSSTARVSFRRSFAPLGGTGQNYALRARVAARPFWVASGPMLMFFRARASNRPMQSAIFMHSHAPWATSSGAGGVPRGRGRPNASRARQFVALIFALFVTVSAETAGAASPTAQASELAHVVQRGQYLSLIAKRYHTSADAIRRRNGLAKSEAIKPGTTLRIGETAEHKSWREHHERKHGKGAVDSARGADAVERMAPRARASSRDGLGPRERPGAAIEGGRLASNTKHEGRSEPRYARKPARRGHVVVARLGEEFRGGLTNKSGHLHAKSAERITWLMRALNTNEQHTIDRRLIKLLAEMSDHFGGRRIEIVSGFRPYSPKQFTRNSRHNHGQAIDFRIIGVPNITLYEHCLSYDKVGCGYYPNSHFIHLDVREFKTRWVDYSRPGQPPSYARARRKAPGTVGSAARATGSSEAASGESAARATSPTTPPAARFAPAAPGRANAGQADAAAGDAAEADVAAGESSEGDREVGEDASEYEE